MGSRAFFRRSNHSDCDSLRSMDLFSEGIFPTNRRRPMKRRLIAERAREHSRVWRNWRFAGRKLRKRLR